MKSKYNPDEVWELLKAGNDRFLQDQNNYRNHTNKQHLRQISTGANPSAIVLTCSDSRVPPEHIFDCGLGDIFVVRNAGNVMDSTTIASIEFAASVFKIPLVIIMGHTNCKAIETTIQSIAHPTVQESNHINALINLIRPAAQHTRPFDDNVRNKAWQNQATIKNVQLNIQTLKTKSTIINDMLFNNEVMIVGAIYDVATGKVEFL